LLEKAPVFEDNKIKVTPALIKSRGVLVNQNKENPQSREFRIKDNSGSASFTAEIDLSPLPNVVNYGEGIGPEVITYRCAGKKGATNFSEDQNIQNALKVESKMLSPTSLQLIAEVFPDKLEPGVTNCFQIILRPVDYKVPQWVTDWNLTDDQADAWNKDKLNFDGSRTYNLSPFLLTIWEAVREGQKPKIGIFNCYFMRG
jgi:hypothetical protein